MFWKVILAIDWIIDGLLYSIAWAVFHIRLWMLLRKVKKHFKSADIKVLKATITGTLSRSTDSVKPHTNIEVIFVKRSK